MHDDGLSLYIQVRTLFPTMKDMGKAFGVSGAAVSMWGKCIPERRMGKAYEILSAARTNSRPVGSPPDAPEAAAASASPEAAFIQQGPSEQVAADGGGPT